MKLFGGTSAVTKNRLRNFRIWVIIRHKFTVMPPSTLRGLKRSPLTRSQFSLIGKLRITLLGYCRPSRLSRYTLIGETMSPLARRLFRKLRELIAPRGLVIASVVGGLALGLSTLSGMLQNPRPLDTRAEIQRTMLHNRVQRVRDALQTAEEAPVDRTISSRLAQWYNWGNWPNGWYNYWPNWPNR
jgi:hypothetical protein